MNCDVLIVGASSAGLMAAISAGESGADVILVDRALAGIGPEHAANTFFQGMADASKIKMEDCYLKHELEGMQIVSPSGRSVKIPAKGFFLDRKRFDEHYINLAESYGVTVLSGSVKETKLQGTRRVVSLDQCQDDSNDSRIDARVVIDASGIQSSVARQAGLEPMLHRADIAWAMEADIELKGLGEEKLFQYWIGSMAPGWKATFSPAGGSRATLAVFVRGHGENVQPFFRSFLKRFKACKAARYPDIESLKINSIRRGGDPIAVMPCEVVADSLMVTGGAAGQSGLIYGMRAGSICGLVAAEASKKLDVSKKSLSRYEKLWNREYYWQYRMGRASLNTLAEIKDSEIDRLVAELSGKRLISSGSFARKAAYASTVLALTRPRTLIDLAENLMRG